MNKYGYPEQAWDAAIKEGTQALIEYAKRRQMVTYSDFVRHITTIRFEGPHDSRLAHFLGEISRSEAEAGRGMLTVLVRVVHKSGDYQPGPGFFNLAKELGYDTADIEKLWVEQLKKVFAVWAK